jgi:hypothetical protein
VCTVLDLNTFVTAFGTEKNLALFEVEGVGEAEGLELENVFEEGIDGGVEISKFELVDELAG